jgi:hypothetical protein
MHFFYTRYWNFWAQRQRPYGARYLSPTETQQSGPMKNPSLTARICGSFYEGLKYKNFLLINYL